MQFGPRPRPSLRRPPIRILGNIIPERRRVIRSDIRPRVLFVRRLELGVERASGIILACQRVNVFRPYEGNDVGKGSMAFDHSRVAVVGENGVA